MNKLLPKSLIKIKKEILQWTAEQYGFKDWEDMRIGHCFWKIDEESIERTIQKTRADTLEAIEKLRKRVLELSMDKEVFIEYGQVEELIYEIFPELKSEAKEVKKDGNQG